MVEPMRWMVSGLADETTFRPYRRQVVEHVRIRGDLGWHDEARAA